MSTSHVTNGNTKLSPNYAVLASKDVRFHKTLLQSYIILTSGHI